LAPNEPAAREARKGPKRKNRKTGNLAGKRTVWRKAERPDTNN